MPVSNRSSSRGSSSGQSPGRRTTRLGAQLTRARDACQRRPGMAALVGVGDHLGAGRRGQLRGPRLARDDDRPLDRARVADRLEHVLEHRRDDLGAARVTDAGCQSLLGGGEALDREDRGRFQPRSRLAA